MQLFSFHFPQVAPVDKNMYVQILWTNTVFENHSKNLILQDSNENFLGFFKHCDKVGIF